MVLDELAVPVVLAPLAGGPSTPALAAAVSNAGGLGFLGAGYRTPDALGEQLVQARALTQRPLAVNLFVIAGRASDPSVYESYVAALGPAAGEPRWDDDSFEAKLAVLLEHPVEVVSFTFGVPPRGTVDLLHAGGTEVWVTVTNVDEATHAVAAGADVLVAQGAEAGGHRGSFDDALDQPVVPMTELVASIAADGAIPIVAAGGIATREHAQRALDAGATAVAAGTAFMLAPEAGTSPPHREAIASGMPTALTRAFTGRLARGIRNQFLIDHPGAPSAYPEIHFATAPIRAAGREAGDAEVLNLWAGTRHALAVARPAAETVAALAGR